MSVKTSELSKPEIIYRGLPHNLPVCGFAQRQMMYFHIIKMDSCISIYMVLREHICHLVTCLGNCAQRMDVVLLAVSVTEQRVESPAYIITVNHFPEHLCNNNVSSTQLAVTG